MSEEVQPKELTGPIPRPAAAEAGLMTIREAAEAFGVSPDTIRRAIKAEQKQAGTGLKAVKRPSKRGDEYAVAPADLEAMGYTRPKPAGERVEEARRDLVAEENRRKLAEALSRAEVAALRAEYAEKRATELERQLSETADNLRRALDRIPLALPPAKPSLVRRLFGKGSSS
jgi:predicted transcriptional regulator